MTEEYSGWSCIMRDPMALPSQALDTIPLTRKLTLSGTGREAHICAFVSPALITAALKGFTMPEGSSLLWQMGGRYYGINGNILTEEPLSDIPAEQLDVDMLDDSTEVYSIAAGYDAQLMVRYPIGVHDLYLIEIIPNGPLAAANPLPVGFAGHQSAGYSGIGLAAGIFAAPHDHTAHHGTAEPHNQNQQRRLFL